MAGGGDGAPYGNPMMGRGHGGGAMMMPGPGGREGGAMGGNGRDGAPNGTNTRALYLHHVPPTVSYEELFDAVGAFGTIESAKLLPEKSEVRAERARNGRGTGAERARKGRGTPPPYPPIWGGVEECAEWAYAGMRPCGL